MSTNINAWPSKIKIRHVIYTHSVISTSHAKSTTEAVPGSMATWMNTRNQDIKSSQQRLCEKKIWLIKFLVNITNKIHVKKKNNEPIRIITIPIRRFPSIILLTYIKVKTENQLCFYYTWKQHMEIKPKKNQLKNNPLSLKTTNMRILSSLLAFNDASSMLITFL